MFKKSIKWVLAFGAIAGASAFAADPDYATVMTGHMTTVGGLANTAWGIKIAGALVAVGCGMMLKARR